METKRTKTKRLRSDRIKAKRIKADRVNSNKIKTIDQRWDVFRRQVLPEAAGAVQLREMKRAFFAGAAALLGASLEVSILSDDAAVVVLEGLHEEAHDFSTREHMGCVMKESERK